MWRSPARPSVRSYPGASRGRPVYARQRSCVRWANRTACSQSRRSALAPWHFQALPSIQPSITVRSPGRTDVNLHEGRSQARQGGRPSPSSMWFLHCGCFAAILERSSCKWSEPRPPLSRGSALSLYQDGSGDSLGIFKGDIPPKKRMLCRGGGKSSADRPERSATPGDGVIRGQGLFLPRGSGVGVCLEFSARM